MDNPWYGEDPPKGDMSTDDFMKGSSGKTFSYLNLPKNKKAGSQMGKLDSEEEIEESAVPKKIRIPTTSKLAEMTPDPTKSFNMMSVLPNIYKQWVHSRTTLPKIFPGSLSNVYPAFAEILDVPDYVVNLLAYWYLDILAEAVEKFQKDGLRLNDQKLLVAWFGHLFSLFQEKGWSREEILSNTREDIIALGYNLENISWAVPAGQSDKSYLITGRLLPKKYFEDESRKRSITMSHIVSLIYDVFANPFQFYLIQNVFFKTPEVLDVKMPHKMNFPKKYKTEDLYPRPSKMRKSGTKSKLSTSSERKSIDVEDMSAYILPLQEAVTDEFFRSIFPMNGFTTPTDSK